jgi:UDP:flavonoid glycosyltransferase YjiC (YdhE family)
MTKKILLFAPVTFDLAETTRMIEIAKGIKNHEAAYAGKPVVGVGMQPEQVANLACLVRKGFAIRVPKSKDPSIKVQEAIQNLLNDEEAKHKAVEFSKVMEKWDGPKMAAEIIYEKFGK